MMYYRADKTDGFFYEGYQGYTFMIISPEFDLIEDGVCTKEGSNSIKLSAMTDAVLFQQVFGYKWWEEYEERMEDNKAQTI